MPEPDILENIEHLQPKPGDVLVFKFSKGTDEKDAARLAKYVQDNAGSKMKEVLILFIHEHSIIEAIEMIPEEVMSRMGWYRADPSRN